MAAEDAAGIRSPIWRYAYRFDEPRYAEWREHYRRVEQEGVGALKRLFDSDEAPPMPSFEAGRARLTQCIAKLQASFEIKKMLERRERRAKIRNRFERPGSVGNETAERQTDAVRRAIEVGLHVVAGKEWLDPRSDEGTRALEGGGSVVRRRLDPEGNDRLEILLALNEPDRFGQPPGYVTPTAGGEHANSTHDGRGGKPNSGKVSSERRTPTTGGRAHVRALHVRLVRGPGRFVTRSAMTVAAGAGRPVPGPTSRHETSSCSSFESWPEKVVLGAMCHSG
jgi:hypothetical protein